MRIFRASRIYDYLEETNRHKRKTKITTLTDSNPRGRKSLSHLRFERRRLENIYIIRYDTWPSEKKNTNFIGLFLKSN